MNKEKHNLLEITNLLDKIKNMLEPSLAMEAIDINKIKGVFLANNTFTLAEVIKNNDITQLVDLFNHDLLASQQSLPLWNFPFGFNVSVADKSIAAFMVDLKYYLPNTTNLTKIQLELVKAEINRFLAKNKDFYNDIFCLKRQR